MSQSILIQIVHNYIINFYPFEVVGRGSETQLQMGGFPFVPFLRVLQNRKF